MEKSNAPGISFTSDDRPICNVRYGKKFSSGYLNESRFALCSLIEKNRTESKCLKASTRLIENRTSRRLHILRVHFPSARTGRILSPRGIMSTTVKDVGVHGRSLLAPLRFRLLLVSLRSRRSSFSPCGSSFSLSLTLISHSIRRSRSVVTPLRLYKFYIIFMRHKVVEKPTEEERGPENRA